MSTRPGIQLGILELDWPVDDPIHPALPCPPPPHARGESQAAHALATAGFLLSRAPDLPGCCTGTDAVLACPGPEGLVGALDSLAQRLADGSVLLIEATVESRGTELPLDTDLQVQRLLRAHAQRLVVVLPAGNSGIGLHGPAPTDAWTIGACDAEGGWWGSSNHGERVVLHAPGHGVPSLGWGHQRVDYRDTSAAAAQIAGIAFQAQHLAIEHTRGPLRPRDLLNRLQRSGSPQRRSGLDPPIGIRPNLDAFLGSLLQDRTSAPRVRGARENALTGSCHEL